MNSVNKKHFGMIVLFGQVKSAVTVTRAFNQSYMKTLQNSHYLGCILIYQ